MSSYETPKITNGLVQHKTVKESSSIQLVKEKYPCRLMQIVKTHIRWWILQHLIWVYSVCLCSFNSLTASDENS